MSLHSSHRQVRRPQACMTLGLRGRPFKTQIHCHNRQPVGVPVRRLDVRTGAATLQPDASGGGDHAGGGGDKFGGDDNFGLPEDDGDDEIIGLDQASAMAAAAGTQLPLDFVALATSEGIKRSTVARFCALQKDMLAGLLARLSPWFRDRLIYDHRFLFKVGAEIAIDSGCATFAEVRKRGADFWDEFHFYFSDLLVGLVLDVMLVGLMAPKAVLGRNRPIAKSGEHERWHAAIQRLVDKVPSAFFERSVPGVRSYSIGSRFGCIGVKFLEYSLGGIIGGLVGQSFANSLMLLRRRLQPGLDDDKEPPPIVQTALVWGFFMGVSSNLRYQAVFGLERLIDISVARRIPQIAYGTTVAIRFANNIIGGENFIDLARYFGVQ